MSEALGPTASTAKINQRIKITCRKAGVELGFKESRHTPGFPAAQELFFCFVFGGTGV
jgi:hypothetical protein